MQHNLLTLSQTIGYLQLFRGQHTGQKAAHLLAAVEGVLAQSIDISDKQHSLQVLLSDWIAWMQMVCPGEDLLRSVCVTSVEQIIQDLQP